MTNLSDLNWYLEVIEKEIQQAIDGRLTGNINFQINMKEGGIANCNCGLGRSFKKPVD